MRSLRSSSCTSVLPEEYPTSCQASSQGPAARLPHTKSQALFRSGGVLVAPGTKPSKDKDRSAGGVRFAEDSPSQAQPSPAESPAASVPLRRRPSATSSASPQVSSSVVSATSPTGTSASSATASGPVQVNIEKPVSMTSAALPKGVKPPLWSFEQPHPSSSSVGHDAKSDRTPSLSSPSLLPEGKHLSVDGGCGFCTEASPCVCADDFLDLPSDSQPSHIAVTSDVPVSRSPTQALERLDILFEYFCHKYGEEDEHWLAHPREGCQP